MTLTISRLSEVLALNGVSKNTHEIESAMCDGLPCRQYRAGIPTYLVIEYNVIR